MVCNAQTLRARQLTRTGARSKMTAPAVQSVIGRVWAFWQAHLVCRRHLKRQRYPLSSPPPRSLQIVSTRSPTSIGFACVFVTPVCACSHRLPHSTKRTSAMEADPKHVKGMVPPVGPPLRSTQAQGRVAPRALACCASSKLTRNVSVVALSSLEDFNRDLSTRK